MPENDQGKAELKVVRILIYWSDAHQETMTEAKRLGTLDLPVKGTVGFGA